ncbi:MAG: C39 family peptidase [Bdellovibrio sp.]|nr:C39 family peptidase [Bdellovibrio sp.]
MRKKILSFCLLVGLLGLVITNGESETQEWQRPKLPDDALTVPLIPQATSYSCGAAAMLAVLTYWQVYEGNESSLYPLLKTTPENGTDPLNMLNFAQELGLKAELKLKQTLDDVEEKFDEGYTIILDFQAWAEDRKETAFTDWRNRWEDGHYAVLVAYDDHNLYFMDPSTIASYAYVPKREFLDRWHDYEIRDGIRVENYQLAIYIKGKNPLQNFPAALELIE